MRARFAGWGRLGHLPPEGPREVMLLGPHPHYPDMVKAFDQKQPVLLPIDALEALSEECAVFLAELRLGGKP